ncbi:hypothetical protein Cylst_2812 [Cylindrospermum stagnale PCC 7417]|uniref:SPOR domain-containing protein n=1 Tax=Cylindrospermum stagnale PCC 7417 TaxID=56107 RepID=K9WYX7_9NOST|nr:hypothetical protein [Cylindrospermum stagnale]AFZ25006.1 hypothetical protein Cylst_2812 [Cylindrospermum stagnale PCC 7417]
MPQNTEYKEPKSENQLDSQAIAYKARLNGWAIARVVPNAERVIVARFRSRSDADGYMRHLRQETPNAAFEVIFDHQREEAVI